MAEVKLTAQQRDAIRLDGSGLLVSAAAGSGKTMVLVERLMRHVLGPEHCNIDQFLVITYTRAAAEELRGKIVKKISECLARDPENSHLRRQSLLVYRTQISTIHGFCSAVIKEYGHVINMESDRRVLDQQDADALLNRALEDLLEERYENIAEDSGFRAVVDTLGAGRDDRKLVSTVLEAFKKARSHPDPARWMEECVSDPVLLAAKAEKRLMNQAKLKCTYWAKVYDTLIEEMSGDEDLEKAYLPTFQGDREWLRQLNSALETGWNETSRLFPFKGQNLGSLRGYSDLQNKERLQELRTKFKNDAKKLAGWFEISEQENIEDCGITIEVVRGLFDMVIELDQKYGELKKRHRAMDYGDLEHFALEILTNNGEASDVAKKISRKYREVMVDEYQDTNAIQNLLFTSVSKNGNNLFVVGDVKQSIYRFNLADPSIFLEKYRSYSDYTDCEKGNRKILLAHNFRSRKEVTDGVNRLFGEIMSEDFGEMNYGEDEELRPEGTFPEASGMETELNITDTGAALDESGEKLSRAGTEARAVAGRIRELLDSGFTVTGDDGCLRPITPDDIVILMRSPRNRIQDYLEALENAGLSGCADGSGEFMDRPEISVMLSYLEIIDNPHQDVHLIGVLRSPLWNFTPDELALIRSEKRKCDFYEALCARGEKDEYCGEFLAKLDDLRRIAADTRPGELLRRIYIETDAIAVFASMPDGRRREESLEMLFRHAVAFEERGMNTLFTFLQGIRALKEQGKDLAGPVLADGNNGSVRIMSIHHSKGLEFPVVILADVMKIFNRDDFRRSVLIHRDWGAAIKIRNEKRGVEYESTLYKAVKSVLENEMMAEEMRVLYVAMTRPKDKLIIFAAMDNPAKKLNDLATRITLPLDSTFLSGAGSVGDWILTSALMRPECTQLRRYCGAQCPVYSSGHSPIVVKIQSCYVEEDEEQQKTNDEKANDVINIAWDGFEYSHPEALKVPSKITATELKKAGSGKGTLSRHFAEPNFLKRDGKLTGAKRGTAIHLAMQYINYEACGSRESVKEELERLYTRKFLTREQAEAVDEEKIVAFFNSETGRLLRQAGEIHREFKFSLLVDAGDFLSYGAGEKVLLQGVVDCWLEFPEGIVIIDFKSDAVTNYTQKERAESYYDQVRTYAYALERITGKPVVKGILYFFATNSGEVVKLS